MEAYLCDEIAVAECVTPCQPLLGGAGRRSGKCCLGVQRTYFFQGIFDFEAVLGGLMTWLMQYR